MRQIFHAKQTSSVSDYITSFTTLVDQLSAYNKAVDPVFYVTRFVDGLRPEIRSVIIVQRPQSLDAACTLALLQEEAGVGGTKDSSRSSSVPAYKPNLKNAMPLPLLPAATKTQAVVAAPAQSDAESKLSALKAYRRATGLCFKCGLKWSKDHKCSQEVLHAVQDIWESLSAIGAPLPGEDVSTAPEQLFLTISSAVTSGAPAYSTIQFVDNLGGIPVTILLDSGSTSSFVSESLVMQLSSQVVLPHQISVSVAGGGVLTTKGILHNVNWSIDHVSFVYDFKILPLTHYDIILGMDWLEQFSPMQIHWKHKWIQIHYKESTITIQGIQSMLPEKLLLQVCCATVEISVPDFSGLPSELQNLLQHYAHLFAPPVPTKDEG
ncbi:uncharacterized protein [Miscanthus floridulus]|uniref:uncharacterized protein n=1 Tax=Miscanthus floridulus TaxID=154761 RepID=UPI00345A0DB1